MPAGAVPAPLLELATRVRADTDTFMVVFGANINFMPDGSYINLMDAGMIKAWVDQGIKDQGATKMNYISAQVPKYTL